MKTCVVRLSGGGLFASIVEAKCSAIKCAYKEIGCEIVEIVRPRALECTPYVMLIDEEGLLKEHPTLNVIGSWLYGMHKHGHPIVGNVVIVKEELTPDGPDLALLNPDEANFLLDYFRDNASEIVNDISKASAEREAIM